ncbi:MAG: phosphoglucosamine mutase, partial [Methanobacteriota archaeon]
QMDGFFPGRPPEPTPENLCHLSSAVRAVNADIGIAHDGDADRIAAVDERGRFIQPDYLLALIAGNIAKKTRGKIITTVDASMVVTDHVVRNGGKIIRTKVGDVYLAQKIVEEKAVFGGEPSGTWIHPDVHLTPDGPLSALRIYELLSKTDKPISSLIGEIPKCHTMRSRIECPNRLKPVVIAKVYELLAPHHDRVETVDGVLLANKEEWTLVRPSGTEQCVRITTEAKNREQLVKKHKETELIVKKLIHDVG